ncbi:arginyl-tRNA--protein transferase 1-like isoform X3 [Portunus trituberculatus]|uniref:arginyl-tRNA--protein transferase 1-like isoform X3 n=1 Tax=Portunus trituberculatus TaxID=210409 RepID=UPI001E1CD666|nr:arginyl-tRNA--protein transferase 1-like isoform X3 [Portunus trituberculatus]
MAAEKDPAYSIVEYMRSHKGYKCGYCKSSDTNFSHGMWAHRMAVGDYQALIDRGWRRSGKYCYKPTMEKTCCPMYTIKCDALEIKLSKSQKKVLKRMHRYLSHGGRKECRTPEMDSTCEAGENEEYVKPESEAKFDVSSFSLPESVAIPEQRLQSSNSKSDNNEVSADCKPKAIEGTDAPSPTKDSPNSNQEGRRNVSPGIGPDASRPPCRKAKVIRQERREAKLAKRALDSLGRGESPMEIKVSKQSNTEKSLEDFLCEPLPANPVHNLEVRLVRSQPSSAEFLQSFKKAHQLYQKYQITIHGDTADKCNESQFKRFLCNSPLEPWQPGNGPEQGYGSFHHQYWLDDRLIAVGVLDILPHCVSSVYLYYDPEYSFLSLGTYASLRELALVRELQRRIASLKWYYMGFYIHSCPKMRYKGKYKPSFLLCPETYEWIPIELATPKLDKAKYSRLNDNVYAVDSNGRVDINKILVLHNRNLVRYGDYQSHFADEDDDEEEEEIREYASLVGAKSAYTLFLCRS